MINRPLRRLAILAVALSAATVVTAVAQDRGTGNAPPSRGSAQTQPGGRGPGDPGGTGGQGGPGGRGLSVGGSMKGMNRALNQLGEQISDPSKAAENLNLINDMERGCVTAKGLPLPADVLANAKDEAAKAALSKTYRAHLFKALQMMIAIESDILDGKADAAKSKLQDLAAYRDATHKELGLKADED